MNTAEATPHKGHIRKSKSDKLYDIIVYTIITILLILVLYPMYFVLIASFSDPTAVSAGEVVLWAKGFSLDGYKQLLQFKNIWIGYRNTIFYALFGTLCMLAVNIPAGYALSRADMYGRKFLKVLYIIPMFFGGGLIPTYLTIKSYGMLDTVWALILPSSISIYYIIVARSFFTTSIPNELWEAAQIDGVGNIGYFFRIVLPLSKAIIAVVALWSAVGFWNSYFSAMIYIRNPDLKPLQLVMRSILIQSQTASTMLTGTAAAEAMKMSELIKYASIIVSSLPVMCLYPFVQKYFNKGVMIGSLKG